MYICMYVMQLMELICCYCRNNRIKELPQELQCCSKLSEIVLSFNQFQKLPPVLYKIKALENIIASDNQVFFEVHIAFRGSLVSPIDFYIKETGGCTYLYIYFDCNVINR